METKTNNKVYWIIGLAIVVLGAYYLGAHKPADTQVVNPADLPANTTSQSATGGVYSYTEAPSHIGEQATVVGTVVEAFTSNTNTTFLDFCSNYKSCPFSAVIFSSARSRFGDLHAYDGKTVSITGVIKSYQGRAEIILDSPSQISVR